jgi:hypothetical protein
MPSIPQHARAVICEHWRWVLALATRSLLTHMLQRLDKHWLVQVALSFDFKPLEEACAPFHHQQGPGAPAQHTVARLVRVLLVKYLHDYSLRQTEEALQRDLLLQWFCGYSPWEEGPDHSTLERFEQWVIAQQSRLFFDETLQQIDADLPQQRSSPQIIDSYALRSRAAKVSLITLLREVAAKLLEALQAAHPLRHTLLTQQLDRAALFGAQRENRRWSEAAVRLATLQKMAPELLRCRRAAYETLQECPPLPTERREPLRLWLERLDKVLADELVIESGEGEACTVRERAKQERGAFRMVSASDPEATLRDHGKDKPVEVGYNNTVVVNSQGLVRESRTETGARPDDQALVAALQSQQAHHDLTPQTLIGDGMYARGKTHAEVHEASAGQTHLVTPPPQYDKRLPDTPQGPRFGPYDFRLSADGATLTCPHGVDTTVHYRSSSGDGDTWRFSAAMCRDCPLRAQCRDPRSKPESQRVVFISAYRTFVLACIAENRTPAYKAFLKLRPRIERLIFCLTNLHGGRAARRFGQDNAQFQSHMVATAYNLRQWMRLRQRRGLGAVACAVALPSAPAEESLPECVSRAA